MICARIFPEESSSRGHRSGRLNERRSPSTEDLVLDSPDAAGILSYAIRSEPPPNVAGGNRDRPPRRRLESPAWSATGGRILVGKGGRPRRPNATRNGEDGPIMRTTSSREPFAGCDRTRFKIMLVGRSIAPPAASAERPDHSTSRDTESGGSNFAPLGSPGRAVHRDISERSRNGKPTSGLPDIAPLCETKGASHAAEFRRKPRRLLRMPRHASCR
jgi:hypothetical protein